MYNPFLEDGGVTTKAECNGKADDSSKRLCLHLFALHHDLCL